MSANWPASKTFPSANFANVKLFRLDSAHYPLKGVEVEDSVLNARYSNGLSFIDSFGKPSSHFYTERTLTPTEQKELAAVLQYNDSCTLSTSCLPFYRDVFVFYDANNHVIAQAQVCFDCRQMFFSPRTTGLFDWRNWGKLKEFVSKVITH